MGANFGMTRRAVFLDRDGILNEAIVRNGRPYPPRDLAELVIPADVRPALENLIDAGYLLFGCTNQPDVARGTTSRQAVDGINRHLLEVLPVTEISVCWHDDADDCPCRKPKPGLLLVLAERYGISLADSWMVGDRWRDVACGHNAGCRTIFVDYGYAEEFRAPPATAVARRMSEVASLITAS